MKTIEPLESACKPFEEDLVLYYYGETSVGEQRRVENHLASCSACRRFLDDLRGLLPHMTRAQEMPQEFWNDFYRETVTKLAEHDEQRAWWRSLLAPTRTWMMPALGTVVAVVLVIGLVFGKGNLSLFLESRQEPIPQEILNDRNQLEFFESMDMLEALSKLESQDDKTDATRSDAGRPHLTNQVA